MAGRKNTPRRACRGVWRTQRIARRASRPTTSTTKRSCYSTRPSSLCSSCCTLTLLNGARRGRSSSAVFAAASIEIAYLNGERSARERPSTLFASGTTARSLSQVSSRATPLRFGDGIVNIKASGEKLAFQPGGTGGLKLDVVSAYTGKVSGSATVPTPANISTSPISPSTATSTCRTAATPLAVC